VSGIQHRVPRRTLSMHTAQALNNVPARYEPARLRQPTPPLTRRGRPLGLGINLSVTTAVPATERTRMAGAAPAKAITTSPTVLHHSLRRLADVSRPPTPEGSLPAFAWGDVASPLNPYPAPYRPAFASSLVLYPQPLRLILRLAFPCGRATGLPRCVAQTAWVRSRLYAGGPSSAPGEFGAPGPGHAPFWSRPVSTFGLFSVTTLAAVHLG
jgi:hypothetical protein